MTIINDVTFYFVEVLSQMCLKRFFEELLLSKSLQENSSSCGTSRRTYATCIHMRTWVLWNIDTPKSISRKVFCWGELKPWSDGFTEIVQGLHVQVGGGTFSRRNSGKKKRMRREISHILVLSSYSEFVGHFGNIICNFTSDLLVSLGYKTTVAPSCKWPPACDAQRQ